MGPPYADPYGTAGAIPPPTRLPLLFVRRFIVNFILNPGINFPFNEGNCAFTRFDRAGKFSLRYQEVYPGAAKSRSMFNVSKPDKFV